MNPFILSCFHCYALYCDLLFFCFTYPNNQQSKTTAKIATECQFHPLAITGIHTFTDAANFISLIFLVFFLLNFSIKFFGIFIIAIKPTDTYAHTLFYPHKVVLFLSFFCVIICHDSSCVCLLVCVILVVSI